LGEDENKDEGNDPSTSRRMSFSPPPPFNLFSLCLLFFSLVFSFLYMTLCFFSFVTGSSHLFLGFLLFWIFLLFFGFWFFWLFPPPLFPLESSVFIRNVPGTPSTHGSFLDKHGWEGGVGFFAGTWIPEVRSLSPWVVIFMKIRFAICVLVGLGCRHSTIYFPSFQANSQRRKKKTKNSSYLTR